MDGNTSNNESQEVSRGRSSEEVTVMVIERRTEQIYQLMKLKLYLYMVLEEKRKTSATSRQRTDESGSYCIG